MSTAGACFPIPAADIKRIGIVGTGVIGSGWAAIFAAKGYEVLAFVRSAASQDKFLRTLERAWRRLEARGLASDPAGWKAVRCTTSLAECVGTAEYVQESVVEELKLKQQMKDLQAQIKVFDFSTQTTQTPISPKCRTPLFAISQKFIRFF